MGISFYTFQSMGYLIDVYRGKYPAQTAWASLPCSSPSSPRWSRGPISRYDDLAQTLYEEHPYDHRNISFGIQRICWGFF